MRISSPPVTLALLLRHRLRHPGRADRHRPRVEEVRGRIGADTPRLHLARTAWSRPPSSRRRTALHAPASPASTRSTLPDADRLGKHLLERRWPDGAASGDAPAPSDAAAWPGPAPAARRRHRPSGAGDAPSARLAPDRRTAPIATGPAPTTSREHAPHDRQRPTAAVTYAAAGVDIEAGDRAVELMKAWVARTPAARGARRHRRLRRPVRRLARSRVPPAAAGHLAPTASAPRSPSPRPMDVHDTIGFDLVGMVVDDLVVCGAEPLFMTDYIACGKVVPGADRRDRRRHRRRLRPGRLRAGRRRDRRAPGPARARTSTTSPAPRPASSRPTTSSGPHRVRAGDVVVAMASSRPALQRLLAGPHVSSAAAGWALDRDVAGARPHPRRGAARADPDLRAATASPWSAPAASTCTRSATSPAAGSPPTWPGCCRSGLTPPSTARPGPRRRSSGSVQRLGRVPRGRSRAHAQPGRRAWSRSCPPTRPTRRCATLAARGLPAWVARRGRRRGDRAVEDRARSCSGAKGVDGGRGTSDAPALTGPARTSAPWSYPRRARTWRRALRTRSGPRCACRRWSAGTGAERRQRPSSPGAHSPYSSSSSSSVGGVRTGSA